MTEELDKIKALLVSEQDERIESLDKSANHLSNI